MLEEIRCKKNQPCAHNILYLLRVIVHMPVSYTLGALGKQKFAGLFRIYFFGLFYKKKDYDGHFFFQNFSEVW